MDDKEKARGRQRKQDFLSALQQTKSIKKACKLCGMNITNVSKWTQNDNWFASELKLMQRTILLELESLAFDQAMDGDSRQIQFLLKAWAPQRYSPNSSVNIQVKDNADVRVAGQDPDKIKTEMADKLLSTIKKLPGGHELMGRVVSDESGQEDPQKPIDG